MNFSGILRKLQVVGIKPSHEIWEVFLIRKINFLSFIAFLNCLTAFLVFPLIGIDGYQWFLGAAVIAAPIVFLINVRLGYIPGSYGFFFVGIAVVGYFSVRLGTESYSLLYFFPITLTIVQLLGRKETRVHMIVNLLLYMTAFVCVGVAYNNGLYQQELSADVLRSLRLFNIIVAGFTSIVFVVQITLENIRQEAMIKQMLREKEILLAEVFHRVKNNMNIVTSLLNLKMNTTDSESTREALSDCRNRVFSMALVHDTIFSRGDIAGLDFGQYAHDLIDEISVSMKLDEEDVIAVNADDIELPLAQAIPAGLILNELLTNSCKHARTPGNALRIDIEIVSVDKKCCIRLKDNGPGMTERDAQKSNSMGMDLISALCEQIGGKSRWWNEGGYNFELVIG